MIPPHPFIFFFFFFLVLSCIYSFDKYISCALRYEAPQDVNPERKMSHRARLPRQGMVGPHLKVIETNFH